MKLAFQGFEHSLEVSGGEPLMLEVRNPVLYSRVCQSIESNEGEFAVEPYTLWDGGEQLKAKGAFLFIGNPFDLPWSAKSSTGLYKFLEDALMESEEVRLALEGFNAQLRSLCCKGSFSLRSDYGFAAEWDLKKYLKTFGFGVDYNKEDSLLDNIMKYLNFIADVGFDAVQVFVNLCSFLSSRDLQEVVSRAFFLRIPILLLESDARNNAIEHCRHYRIDQELVGEYV